MNVLIADDEKQMLGILKVYFQNENFNVFLAQDGEEAIKILYEKKIDLAIVDWMMPKISGIELCMEIKKNKITKVLMLTAKNENDDEFIALSAGADEYVRKPFDPRILVIRAKKLLKEEQVVHINDFKINFESKKVYKSGNEVIIKNKEFELLKCFIRNKGIILSRKKLLDIVWGLDYFGDERTVDTHIRRLREKIGQDFIKTYRRMGYCLEIKNE